VPHFINLRTFSGKPLNIVFQVTAFVIVFGVLCSIFNDDPVVADGYENLTTAMNIRRNGVFSSQDSPQPLPDMKREPLHPFLVLLYTILLGLSDYSVSQLATEFASYFKVYNVLLIALAVSIAVGWGQALTGKSLLPFAVVTVCACALYAGVPRLVNRFNSEPLGMLLLLLASRSFYFSVVGESTRPSYFLGIWLGLLALTKAHFLLLGPIILGIAALRVPKRALIAGIVFCVLVLPWMLRNYIQFGDPNVSKRGMPVLAVRYSLVNDLTDEEFSCMAYAVSHPRMRETVGKVLGVNSDSFLRHGKCQRLNRETCFDTALERVPCKAFPEDVKAVADQNPDEAIQLWYKGMITGQLLEAKKLLATEVFRPTLATIWRFLTTLPLFMYRGVWFTESILLCMICVVSLLALLFSEYRWISVIALSSCLFQVIATHNLPRFHLIETAVMLVAIVLVTNNLGSFLRNSLGKIIVGRRGGRHD